jgi:TPR repeat protein
LKTSAAQENAAQRDQAREARNMTEMELKGLATLDASNADVFYQLGILYSAGGEIQTDYVTAHKWFNIAASRGNAEAMRMRREIAEEMSEVEVATAQRAARDWLKSAKDGKVAAPVGGTVSVLPGAPAARTDRQAA